MDFLSYQGCEDGEVLVTLFQLLLELPLTWEVVSHLWTELSADLCVQHFTCSPRKKYRNHVRPCKRLKDAQDKGPTILKLTTCWACVKMNRMVVPATHS